LLRLLRLGVGVLVAAFVVAVLAVIGRGLTDRTAPADVSTACRRPPSSRTPSGSTPRKTALHAAQHLRTRGRHRAIVATQYFHVPRTELLLRRYGVDVVGRVHARFVAPRDAYSTTREVAALGVLLLGPPRHRSLREKVIVAPTGRP
jgi:hypothetical protein